MAARERVQALGGSFGTDSPTPERRVMRALLPTVPLHA
jgi:hypothetical protein